MCSLPGLDIHCLMPLDISAPGSQAVGPDRGFTLAPVLRPLGLDGNHMTGFRWPPACRKQITGLFSLHNHVNQISTHLYTFSIY